MDSIIIKKLDDFFAPFPKKQFEKGAVLLQAGTNPTGIFYITSGIVRNYWISQEGSEITLNMYKPHTFLPMSWAIADIHNAHFYEAMTDVTTKFAPKEKVLLFLRKEPDVVYDLLRRIYIGMEGLWMHMESLATGSSYTKLVASLVILAKRFGKQVNEETVMQLKMSERDLANYAGMSRETASRELQKLKKANLVSLKKGIITIQNIHMLEDKLLR